MSTTQGDNVDNTNRGSIWKNERKETDTQPDFTGTLDVGGVEYWVSAWKRKPDAKPKAPALTFSIRPKDEPAAPAPAPTVSDDDIPF
jgi:type IV secretory pathway VirB10-like protein